MANGYGDYSKKHLAHLRLIRSAKDLGFTQKEMIELVSLAEGREESCDRVHSLTGRQLANVIERISALEKIKSALTVLLTSCENNTLNECPALTELLAEPISE
jgi:DNA-binding transcriptional MerR regulator